MLLSEASEQASMSQAGHPYGHRRRPMPSIYVRRCMAHGNGRHSSCISLIPNPWPHCTIATTSMAAPFDMSALSNILNDPSIKQMAEQIAQDPAFAQMAQAMQGGGGMPPGMMPPGFPGAPGAAAAGAGAQGGEGGSRSAEEAAAAAMADPSAYADAMSGVFANPQFLEMAEKLGQQLMQDPAMANFMQQMSSPNYREDIEAKMEALKEDPEMAPIMKEIEEGGPSAMMKYWTNPAVVEKISAAMGQPVAEGAQPEGEEAIEGGEEDEEEDEEPNVHSAASTGDVAMLKELLDQGAAVDEQDAEGRTGLHFACGYDELACAEVLMDKGANVDVEDTNKNTPLHYAAGYGRADAIEMLLKKGAKTDIKNMDGKTALEVAELNDQTEAAELLKKAQDVKSEA